MVMIRNAREDEAMELAGIGLRSWESAVEGWADPDLLRANAERAFVDFTRRHFLSIDVAEKNAQITAWAARENLDNKITDLWVDPIWQGQGFGTLLLETLEEEIREQGYDTITIETHSQNEPALSFLKSRGYAINWMTASWSALLDRDVDTVGLIKMLVAPADADPYSEF